MLEKKIEQFGLSSFQLKVIALLAMTVDHAGVLLMGGNPYYKVFRIIGRLAFPIYCFLITEGFTKTRDVKKYAIRLFIFALISEIPFNYLASRHWFTLKYQNVFFTLLLGVLMLCWYKYFSDKNKFPIAFLGVPVFMALAYFLRTDYSWWGVLTIFIFYAFKDKKIYMTAFQCLSIILYGGLERFALVALAPILLYNGKKGRSMKYFFYIYYPAHILALIAIRYFIRHFLR